jgi:hypothetical protein
VTEISDDDMRAGLAQTREYALVLLHAGDTLPA